MTNEEIISSVRALARGEDTYLDISKLLFRHKCFYLLTKAKRTAFSEKAVSEMALHGIAVNERYKNCRRFFEDSGIKYAVIKGAVLSIAAYGGAAYRPSSDIDILIDRRDIDRTKSFLLSEGFIQGRLTDSGIVPFSRREIIFQSSQSHQAAPYIKKTSNPLCMYVNIDINTDIFWGESECHADMRYVLGHTEKTAVGGIELFKLSPEAEFISLCLHHYKDMNSVFLLMRGKLRLSLFCDIYFYLKSNKPPKEKLSLLAAELDAERYIYYCLYYTKLIFDDDIISEYMDIFSHASDTDIIESFGLCDSERRKWKTDFFTRLFSEDISEHIKGYLNEKDIEKLRQNDLNM